MDRMKFEGRMNYFMLTAIRSAKNEDGLISNRDLKAIELMKELIQTNYSRRVCQCRKCQWVNYPSKWKVSL
jgi:hypothetical protein